MNLVAHQLLSFNNPDWQIGNHLGEVVKGKKFETYPKGIQTGILLHRFIDTFSDEHMDVKKSTFQLHKNQRKFSPIVIDIYYDFLLLKNWDQFSDTPFSTFKQNCYQVLLSAKAIYPKRLAYMTTLMVEYDWFEKYRTYDGLELVMKKMGTRAKFPNNMHTAVKDLYMNESKFEEDFLQFFPEIQMACRTFLGLDAD